MPCDQHAGNKQHATIAHGAALLNAVWNCSVPVTSTVMAVHTMTSGATVMRVAVVSPLLLCRSNAYCSHVWVARKWCAAAGAVSL
jgi:hypothetical protein